MTRLVKDQRQYKIDMKNVLNEKIAFMVKKKFREN